jgi:hypothetical protein
MHLPDWTWEQEAHTAGSLNLESSENGGLTDAAEIA